LSLLIVRCPLKPLNGGLASSPSDWQDSACAEHFEWCFIENEIFSATDSEQALSLQTGIGSTESMPYADQALVLIPTIDVRLIEAKVPLANAKKLQQILPNLIEEYLLGGAQSLSVQAFPPVPGKPAVQRTLALIDRAWYVWLSKQMEVLLCPRVRLIPDCLMLDFISTDASIAPSIGLVRDDGNIILTKRTGEQLGVAWIERENVEQGIALPSSLGTDKAVEVSWDWLAPSAIAFIKENTSSKSANFALNLLPKTFKRQTAKSGISSLSELIKRQRSEKSGSASHEMAWTDPLVWRQPMQWALYGIGTLVMGFVMHLGWLAFDNWRWGNQMELLAAQSLNSASVTALAQNTSNASLASGSLLASSSPLVAPTTVLGAFIKQVTQEQRRQGIATDADFASMAAKLQQLKSAFGPEVLQKIDYDGYAMDFEFKPGSVKQLAGQSVEQNMDPVIQKARALGFMVKPLGGDRYRLEPYAGLGMGS